jgi:hypothetical protein
VGRAALHGELLKLGIDVGVTSGTSTWCAVTTRPRKPGGPSWTHHVKTIVSLRFPEIGGDKSTHLRYCGSGGRSSEPPALA